VAERLLAGRGRRSCVLHAAVQKSCGPPEGRSFIVVGCVLVLNRLTRASSVARVTCAPFRARRPVLLFGLCLQYMPLPFPELNIFSEHVGYSMFGMSALQTCCTATRVGVNTLILPYVLEVDLANMLYCRTCWFSLVNSGPVWLSLVHAGSWTSSMAGLADMMRNPGERYKSR